MGSYTGSPAHIAQATRALERAQYVREARAALKDRIHADPTWHALVDVVAGELEPDVAGPMRLLAVLEAAPGMGPGKVRRLCREARLRQPAMRRRLDELDPGERFNLCGRLRAAHRRLSYPVLERIAAAPRDWNRSTKGRAAA